MKHLSPAELLELLRKASVEAEHRLMIVIAYWHGLRVSELINLRRDNLQDGFLVLQRLKGSQPTCQKYVKHADPLLDEYAGLIALEKSHKPGELLFPSMHDKKGKQSRFKFYYLIKKVYGKRAGIPQPKLGTHIFKHSIAMHSRKILGIEELRKHLGHTNISSTGYYLDADQDEVSEKLAAGLGASVK